MSGFRGLNTGIALPSAASPCETPIEPCTLYSPETEGRFTHIFTLDEPRQFKAFGLQIGDSFTLHMVYGDQQEPVNAGGVRIEMTLNNNYMLLAAPGRYRFEFSSADGDVWLFCEPIKCCNAEIVSRSKMMGGNLVV